AARSSGFCIAARNAGCVWRGDSAAVGPISPQLRVDRGRRHGRSRGRRRPNCRRVHEDAREMDSTGAGAVLLASSPVEASTAWNTAGARRSTRESEMSRATERLTNDKRAWFGGGVIVLLALLAIAAPLLARKDPFGIDLISSLEPPSL